MLQLLTTEIFSGALSQMEQVWSDLMRCWYHLCKFLEVFQPQDGGPPTDIDALRSMVYDFVAPETFQIMFRMYEDHQAVRKAGTKLQQEQCGLMFSSLMISREDWGSTD